MVNPLTVEDEIVAALRRIIRAIDLHSRSLVQRFGLTGAQLLVLKELIDSSPRSVSELAAAVKLFMTLPGVLEAAVLSTCNRFEAYLVLEDGTDCFAVMNEFWRRRKGVETADRRRLFYVRHGSTVARHLFRVVSGLESLVLGEYQIQSQVKEAYSAACSASSITG